MPRFEKKTMPEIRDLHASSKSPLEGRVHLLVHNIRSLHNVGSIFRTADCFGITDLILSGYTPYPPDPKLSKTALGADETVSWRRCEDPVDLLKDLKQQHVRICALEQTWNSTPLQDFTPPVQPVCLVIGNEVSGIDPQLLSLCDVSLEIPQFGTKHSFNVSVATGIVLYALFQKWTPM